jgi:ribokinase
MSCVVVVGSVNVDLVVSAPRIPRPGETILGSELVQRPGGKGGNQAVAARRLGADCVLVAAIGADRLGAELQTHLAEEGLDLTQVVVTPERATGVALIVVDGAGENSIVVAPGANHALDATAVARAADVFEPADVLSLQIEVPLAASLEAARLAHEAGATVLLNAAPLPEVPDAALDKLLAMVDVLVVNECEARALTGAPEPADLTGWARLAGDIHALGPRLAVVTLGPRGAVAADGDRTYRQAAFCAEVVDTTGAGDSFAGALAVAFAEGRPVAESLRRACAAGALATTRLGAQEALPTATELQRFLRTAREAA